MNECTQRNIEEEEGGEEEVKYQFEDDKDVEEKHIEIVQKGIKTKVRVSKVNKELESNKGELCSSRRKIRKSI
jgi:hypothetical protein